MPLKPVYKRAPLLTLKQLPVSCGAVSTTEPAVRKLYELCKQYPDEISLLEGSFGLSCLLTQDPMQEMAAQKIISLTDALKKKTISLSETDQISLMRAALSVYEYNGDKSLVSSILSWCANKEAEWDQLIADDSVRQCPADLMELLVRLYRRTGSKGLLRLCTRLRSQSLDWTSILKTFDQNRGLKKLIDRNELKEAISKENGDETAYYTRLYLTNNAVNYADGIRYTAFTGQFSGNGQEMSAGERGWDMIKKYHYAVCGGSTADRTLQGMGTHRAVDAASTAAWCEALCRLYQVNSKAAVLQDIMDLTLNAIPALFSDANIAEYQFVNILKDGAGSEKFYDPDETGRHMIYCLARLSRAIDLLYRTAVTQTENGISINLMLPCNVRALVAGKPCALISDGRKIILKTKEDVKAGIFFAAANDIDVSVNGDSAFRVISGSRILLDRIWKSGDQLITESAVSVRSVESHHHSSCIKKGSMLYAIPASEKKFAYAVCGEPEEREGKIYAPFRKVKDWKQVNGIPNNVPVYPVTEGAVTEIELVPYATLKNRIAVFPRGKADT